MKKLYSAEEIKALSAMIDENGHLTYQSTAELEEDYFKRTGVHRVMGVQRCRITLYSKY